MIPKLRFPGFSGEWKVKKLGEIAKDGFSNGVFNDPAKVGSGYRLINVKDMYTEGTIDDSSLSLVGLDKKEFRRNKVEYGDIFFTRSSLVKEGIAYSNIYLGQAEDVTYDGHLIRMQPVKSAQPIFMKLLLGTSKVRKQLVAYGTTTTMTTIGQKEVSAVEVAMPSLGEQEKIAGFLTVVDERVAAIDKNVELLKQYKKGVMQKIFTQQIRFKDKNGNDYPAWQVMKLGEVSTIKKGEQLNGDLLTKTGSYPMLNGGIKPSGYTDRYNTEAETVTVSEGGNSCGYVSYMAQKFWTGGHLYALADLKINKQLLYQQLKFKQDLIMRLRVGSGLPNIQKGDLAKLPLNVPSEDEQKKIADFLTSFDGKIKTEEAKLAATKKFKKSLLQRMFV